MAYLPLSTANLPNPAIDPAQGSSPADYFGTLLWTGTGGSRTIADGESGVVGDVNFTPDFSWIKSRSLAASHSLYDAVRTAGKRLASDSTGAEGSNSAFGYLSSFTDGGFGVTTGTDGGNPDFYTNESSATYVAWNWKAGGTAVSNTSGTIASQVSANTDAGFSIVSYTGNATRGATFGHGLGAVPSFVIIKNREDGAENWLAWHQSLSGTFPSLRLNTTGATTDSGDGVVIRGSEFTSSVISVGENPTCNGNNQGMIAYCWTEIEGYSKFGSFSGNNSTDGPFIHLGFRPALFVVKCTNTYGSWYAYDTTRANYNPMGASAAPIGWDLSGAEASPDSSWYVDAVSSGIKIRNNSNFDNGSNSFVYMAFADSPTKYSSAR